MKKDILFKGFRIMCLAAILAGLSAGADAAAPAGMEAKYKEISEANNNYRLAREKIQGISRGVTTEKEVQEMLGSPLQVLDAPKPPRLGGEWWWKAIRDGDYLAPKKDQKVFVYEYTSYTLYSPPSIRGEKLQLFITINKKTGVVEFFTQYIRPWGKK